MPTFKLNKNKTGLFSSENLNEAVREVLECNVSIRKAAAKHDVPRTTLTRYVKQATSKGKTTVTKYTKITKQVINNRYK